MARSSYVYVVTNNETPVAGFTVKWELKVWWDNNANKYGPLRVWRLPDSPGYRTAGREIAEITEEFTT